MRIIIDLSYAQDSDMISGGFEYGKKIFDRLNDVCDVTILLIEGFKIDEWILSKAKNIEYIKADKWSKDYWKQFDEIINRYDEVYIPYQINRHTLKINKCKLFITIHDLVEIDIARKCKINSEEKLYITIDFKKRIKLFIKKFYRMLGIEQRRLKKNMGNNIKNASKIIAVSEYTKKDIMSRFNTPSEKIEVYYSPLKVVNKGAEESKMIYKDYYLLISAHRFNKNIHRGIIALDELYSNNKIGKKTIVVGNCHPKIKALVKNIEKFEFLNYVAEEDLEYLYKNAYLFIFPSLAEGFGYPPLEAMKYGTKTITSNAMSLYELYNQTYQFDPYDINSIKEAIVKSSSLTKEKMISIYNNIATREENDLIKTVCLLSGNEAK